MSSQKRSRANYESNGPPSHAPYAVYGTPLPAFDPEVRDDGSYVPIWKQEVTDERGRKRLHGAFTGGWSAGYFNSVGSKEGWTPATFVSSRGNRAQKPTEQRAEDFMDDEDLAEQAESQKLETQGAFAGLGGVGQDSSKGMFADLFKTTGETMGVKLLQRMGWKQGQGIGPKVQRLAQGDKTGELHAFAPDNARMVSFVRKNDRKGIGFEGETGLAGNAKDDEQSDDDVDARILSRSKVLTKPKKAIKTSFGVGAMNDTGSDDEDPYSIGPQIKYNRIIGGNKSKKKGGLVASTVSAPKLPSQKLAERSVNMLGGLRKCHDGRFPIAGFVLATKIDLVQVNLFPPPDVPADWKPAGLQRENNDGTAYQSTADAAKASALDAKSRASLLGEQALPGKSVFDFLSTTTRDKLASASGRKDLPQARGEAAPADSEQSARKSMWDNIPHLDKDTARAALQRGRNGWMPYAEEPTKRERYKTFLSIQAGMDNSFPQRPHAFSTEEWVREMKEFVQAAEVFKPISGLMAARFTSSTSDPALASDQPDKPVQATKVEDPAEEAAKAGMYGVLTRSRMLFHPTRLLCKRFAVKTPATTEVDPDAGEHGEEHKSDLVGKTAIDHMMMHAKFSTATAESSADEPRRQQSAVDVTHNEAVEGMRADEATLKSIFEP